jgi:hypothetical protein
MISGASKEDIRATITSGQLLDQQMALAGALRNYGSDEAFLQELLPFLDEEVTAKMSSLPRNRSA